MYYVDYCYYLLFVLLFLQFYNDIYIYILFAIALITSNTVC